MFSLYSISDTNLILLFFLLKVWCKKPVSESAYFLILVLYICTFNRREENTVGCTGIITAKSSVSLAKSAASAAVVILGNEKNSSFSQIARFILLSLSKWIIDKLGHINNEQKSPVVQGSWEGCLNQYTLMNFEYKRLNWERTQI